MLRRYGTTLAGTLLALAAGVLASVLLPGQYWSYVRQWYEGTPRLEVPASVVVEECERGEIVERSFDVRNRGGGVLTLDQFRTGCACTVLEQVEGEKSAPVRTLSLRPGERARLSFRMAVRVPPGKELSEAAYFRTNDPERPEVSVLLTIRRVRGGLLASPPALAFGEVSLGSKALKTITVRDPASRPRQVVGVDSTDPSVFRVRFVPDSLPGDATEAGAEGVRLGQIEVEVISPRAGFFSGGIRFLHSGENSEGLVVPVTARVAAAVEATPAAVLLPRSSGAGPVFYTDVLCRSTAGLPLELMSEDIPPGLTASVTREAGNAAVARVRIEWKPASGTGNLVAEERRLRFRAKVDNRESTLEIPVRLRYDAPHGSRKPVQ
jgi:hypothetical protein